MTLLQTNQISIERKNSPSLNFSNLSIGKGEHVLLLGPSGCGKTTLLSILAGLLSPTTGQVLWQDQDFYAFDASMRDAIRGREFGFVFQTLHLIPSLSLRQNIALAADMAGLPDNKKRIDGLLARLGLADKAHRKPAALSQGEQQRGALARAVLNAPLILMADEPTSALDDNNALIAINLLIEQAEETGAALLVATHDSRIRSRFQKIISLENSLKVAA